MTKPTPAPRRVTAALAALAAAAFVSQPEPALAFCGFYVAKADAKLFNQSSKVVLARDGEKTAITMASDYEGEPKEFAVVIPVPTFIERKQIGVVDMKTIDHLDAFTAPRLVEYHDKDPCAPEPIIAMSPMVRRSAAMERNKGGDADRYRGVTIEASYDVGEYDVLILSAKESDGLVNWLTDNDYKIPAGAGPVLGSYIKQDMRFFLAKVNLDRMALIGAGYLRPLQVRYETAKFMLPLRLGTVNAKGPQDIIIYTLTKKGRVEAANYRTVKLPSNVELPLFVKDDFSKFYKAMFDRLVTRERMRAVIVEYAWDMGWCDPCAADPLSNKQVAELGARWIASDDHQAFRTRGRGTNVFVTRMHVRYDQESFPEDIVFLETHDRANFQGRYILRHPWKGTATCKAAETYRASLPSRFRVEAANLAALTGWSDAEIEQRMSKTGQPLRNKN